MLLLAWIASNDNPKTLNISLLECNMWNIVNTNEPSVICGIQPLKIFWEFLKNASILCPMSTYQSVHFATKVCLCIYEFVSWLSCLSDSLWILRYTFSMLLTPYTLVNTDVARLFTHIQIIIDSNWPCVRIMPHTRFRVNLNSVVVWMWKKLFARDRHDIWKSSDWNRIWTHKHLVRKRAQPFIHTRKFGWMMECSFTN